MGLLVVFVTVPAYGLRCSGRIVSIEDTTAKVMDVCGEPQHVKSWEEKRITDEYFYFHYKSRKKSHGYYPATDSVSLEEWTYNFGPTVFIRYLLFENGRLKEITLGDKGYYQK
jgi:Protein of unknown function (DUF2845)